jgi:probable F420-dependent oxidoreductase
VGERLEGTHGQTDPNDHESGTVVTPGSQLSTSLRTFSTQESGSWSHLVECARAADEAGIDRLVMSDHVAFGENLEAYGDPRNGGSKGKRQPTGPDGAWLDPVATIAHLTAVTTRVRFATNILIAALRRPVVLAKMAATIDVLSNGRLDLGVGVGWQREEYEAAGLPFEARGELLNRTIEICQVLWRQRSAKYESDSLRFSNIHQMPKPLQPQGIPVWVSGTVNSRAMDRLARYGVGWIPWGDDASDIESGIGRMRAAMVERGRNPGELGVVGTLRPAFTDDGALDVVRTMEPVPRLRHAGVTDFRVSVGIPEGQDAATDFLGALVTRFRAVAS